MVCCRPDYELLSRAELGWAGSGPEHVCHCVAPQAYPAYRADPSETPKVHDAWQRQHELLLQLIVLTMTDLDKPTRQKIMCAITLDAHNRDVQQRLHKDKVTSKDAFQWQSMLKCYWLEEPVSGIRSPCRPRSLGCGSPDSPRVALLKSAVGASQEWLR